MCQFETNHMHREVYLPEEKGVIGWRMFGIEDFGQYKGYLMSPYQNTRWDTLLKQNAWFPRVKKVYTYSFRTGRNTGFIWDVEQQGFYSWAKEKAFGLERPCIGHVRAKVLVFGHVIQFRDTKLKYGFSSGGYISSHMKVLSLESMARYTYSTIRHIVRNETRRIYPELEINI